MTSDVYGRILATLAPPVLQHHCSLVFDDELSAISAELRGIAAAYERLQEVREAVATLENGRTDVSRSASLMETVDSTAQLEGNLMQRMDLLGAVLRSRPVVRLDDQQSRRNATKTEDDDVEERVETRKKEKKKRRRRDSTDDDAFTQKEEPGVEYGEPEPAPPEKKSTKSKKSKKSEHDTHALEATSRDETPTSSNWVPSQSTAPTDTHTEAAEQATPNNNSKNDLKGRREPGWMQSVREAIGPAQRMVRSSRPLTLEEATSAVELLCSILDAVVFPKGAKKVSTLVNGQFTSLIINTTRILDKTVQDPLVASLANTIIRSMENAIERDHKLSDLRKHVAEFTRIRNAMAGSDARSPQQTTKSTTTKAPVADAKTTDFDWPAWRQRVADLLITSSLISPAGQKLSFTQVSAFASNFRDTLQMLEPSSATNMNASTRNDFFAVIESAAHVFKKPGVTKPFIPLLNKVMFAIDDAIKLHSRFSCLRQHSRSLLAIRDHATEMHAQNETQKMNAVVSATACVNAPTGKASEHGPGEMVFARFEALAEVADELRALKVSERRGQAAKYVSSLQKELKATFPVKGQRFTPSRTTYQVIIDAVTKAILLIQGEPHDEHNEAVYKQFLELLFTIGSRYSMFKKSIARSRDDLYLYLYPDSTPTNNQPSSKLKSSEAAQSKSKGHQQYDEDALYGELKAAYTKIQSWDHDVFSLKEFDEVMRVLRGVMAVNTKTWRVRRDHTVAGCLSLIAQRANAIKKKEHREGRLASIVQWQKLMEV